MSKEGIIFMAGAAIGYTVAYVGAKRRNLWMAGLGAGCIIGCLAYFMYSVLS